MAQDYLRNLRLGPGGTLRMRLVEGGEARQAARLAYLAKKAHGMQALKEEDIRHRDRRYSNGGPINRRHRERFQRVPPELRWRAEMWLERILDRWRVAGKEITRQKFASACANAACMVLYFETGQWSRDRIRRGRARVFSKEFQRQKALKVAEELGLCQERRDERIEGLPTTL